MKFEVGDKIIVKHTNEDGVVKSIINDKTVMVEVRGVKFPAHTDHLDFPYFKMFTQQMQAAKKPARQWVDDIRRDKTTTKYQVAEGVWLLLFPKFAKDVFDDEQVDSLKIYLVNQTKQTLHFKFWLKLKNELDMELNNTIGGLSDFYLLNLDVEQLNDNPDFDFEFSLAKPDKSKADYFEANYKPKARQLFQQITDLQKKGEAFHTIKLFTEYPDKPKEKPVSFLPAEGVSDKLKAAGFKVLNNKALFTNDPPPPGVFDLHIEKLTDSYSHMLPHEKLQLQLQELDKYLDKLELHFVKQAIIIHGVGSGKLRDEVHLVLNHRHNVKSFVQQHHPWYGNGATEVYFK